ncbi:4Fe-4S dicluster domain-containing protein [bacterium]|jgi:NADH-quinone oxidoreductase subunit I|nr:4Fe-4S dicluster domain-containing protein [bacterium]
MFRKVIEHFLNVRETRKVDTEYYPDPVSSRGKDDFPARARGLVFNEIEKCTACGECVKVCPTRCIRVEARINERNNRAWVSRFEVDFSNCVFCGLCVDVCEPNSLVQTKEVQAAVFDRADLVTNFGRGEL